jgi:hypothetical protein
MSGTIRPDATGGWTTGRLPLALLAVVATAYEDRMDGDAGRATWRTDQRFTQWTPTAGRQLLVPSAGKLW